MKIDSDAIRELAELLNETGLTEVEVADGDTLQPANINAPITDGIFVAVNKQGIKTEIFLCNS